MASERAGLDCSKATKDSPIAGCDLHAQVMGGPKTPLEAQAPAPAVSEGTQKIIVQIELVQPTAPKEPDHIKVHHNPFSIVGRAIGHFGKQYALGVKDSIEPRNLGRMTLPVAIGLGSQLVIANQIKKGVEGGFNQVGAGINKLGQGEAQLGANQVQIAQQLAGLQQEITALEGAGNASKVVGGIGKSAGIVKESSASFAPKIASGISPESIVTMPLQGGGGVAPVVLRTGDAGSIASAQQGAIGIVNGAGDGNGIQLAVNSQLAGNLKSGGDTQISGNATLIPASLDQSIAGTSSATAPDFNVGVDSKGFAVPMTPKQLNKAKDYQAHFQNSESQLADTGSDFDKKFADIAVAMSSDKGSTAFLNDLKMRYQYAMAYDRQGDHNSARAYLSDCKQDTDNLKRMAKADRNMDVIEQLDGLKQTVNQLDDIEKHFKKRPGVVLSSPEQMQST